MQRILLENFRCFGAAQSAPLAPLTLLVGENSTGKSTFLAVARLAWDLAARPGDPDFNEEPFLLGSFNEIATLRRGPRGRAKDFVIGAQLPVVPEIRQTAERKLAEDINVSGRFVAREGQPQMSCWQLECHPFHAAIRFGSSSRKPEATVRAPSGEVSFKSKDPSFFSTDLRSLLGYMMGTRVAVSAEIRGEISSAADIVSLMAIASHLPQASHKRPYAFAPIRTRPQRTYDPLKADPRPEGSHVPMVLARIYGKSVVGWDELADALQAFGRASGLFKEVRVRKIGKKEGNPFQITVSVAGSYFNLTDVGYGVSQALPILVDCVRAEEGSTFLLQQPEVHLHPRAQAELGSFLGLLAKRQNKRFLIETHSDHLVDRVRMDVRDGRGLSPEDVALLYFERDNGMATIRHIEIDEQGNLRQVPASYRRFFLEEERRLLLGGGG